VHEHSSCGLKATSVSLPPLIKRSRWTELLDRAPSNLDRGD